MHGQAHVEAAAARVGEALGAHQRVVVVAALPAVLLREAEADEAEVAPSGAGPSRARGSPRSRRRSERAPSGPRSFIDSRRSSCSWVKIRCLRAESKSGLSTCSLAVAVAIVALLRSRVWKVDSSTLYFLLFPDALGWPDHRRMIGSLRLCGAASRSGQGWLRWMRRTDPGEQLSAPPQTNPLAGPPLAQEQDRVALPPGPRSPGPLADAPLVPRPGLLHGGEPERATARSSRSGSGR